MAALCLLMIVQVHLLRTAGERPASRAPDDAPLPPSQASAAEGRLQAIPLSAFLTFLVQLDRTPSTALSGRQRECIHDILVAWPDRDGAAAFRVTAITVLRDDQIAWLQALPVPPADAPSSTLSPFTAATTALSTIAGVPADTVEPAYADTATPAPTAGDLTAESLARCLPSAVTAPPEHALSRPQARRLLAAYRAYEADRQADLELKKELVSILDDGQRTALSAALGAGQAPPPNLPGRTGPLDARAAAQLLSAPR